MIERSQVVHNKSTLLALAQSLYAGSVKLDEIQIELQPAQIQDLQYHRFQLEQCQSVGEFFTELNYRVERAWVDGVIVWERR